MATEEPDLASQLDVIARESSGPEMMEQLTSSDLLGEAERWVADNVEGFAEGEERWILGRLRQLEDAVAQQSSDADSTNLLRRTLLKVAHKMKEAAGGGMRHRFARSGTDQLLSGFDESMARRNRQLLELTGRNIETAIQDSGLVAEFEEVKAYYGQEPSPEQHLRVLQLSTKVLEQKIKLWRDAARKLQPSVDPRARSLYSEKEQELRVQLKATMRRKVQAEQRLYGAGAAAQADANHRRQLASLDRKGRRLQSVIDSEGRAADKRFRDTEARTTDLGHQFDWLVKNRPGFLSPRATITATDRSVSRPEDVPRTRRASAALPMRPWDRTIRRCRRSPTRACG